MELRCHEPSKPLGLGEASKASYWSPQMDQVQHTAGHPRGGGRLSLVERLASVRGRWPYARGW